MGFQSNINSVINSIGVASRANDIRNLKNTPNEVQTKPIGQIKNAPNEVQTKPIGQIKNIEPQKVQKILVEKIQNNNKARELYLQRVARIGQAREAKLKKQIEALKVVGGKQ